MSDAKAAADRSQGTVDGLLNNESARELCRHLNRRIRIEGLYVQTPTWPTKNWQTYWTLSLKSW